jgi:hypothetical protein
MMKFAGIQFPPMHIRDSVMNAIQNGLEDMEVAYPSMQVAPIVPGASTSALGQEIEEGIAPGNPVQPTSDPLESAAVQETLLGGSPLAGLLGGGLG